MLKSFILIAIVVIVEMPRGSGSDPWTSEVQVRAQVQVPKKVEVQVRGSDFSGPEVRGSGSGPKSDGPKVRA